MKTDTPNLAIMKSKAVGEPPLMYGIGSFFAITDAIKAYNPLAKGLFKAPMTHERVLMALHNEAYLKAEQYKLSHSDNKLNK